MRIFAILLGVLVTANTYADIFIFGNDSDVPSRHLFKSELGAYMLRECKEVPKFKDGTPLEFEGPCEQFYPMKLDRRISLEGENEAAYLKGGSFDNLDYLKSRPSMRTRVILALMDLAKDQSLRDKLLQTDNAWSKALSSKQAPKLLDALLASIRDPQARAKQEKQQSALSRSIELLEMAKARGVKASAFERSLESRSSEELKDQQEKNAGIVLTTYAEELVEIFVKLLDSKRVNFASSEAASGYENLKTDDPNILNAIIEIIFYGDQMKVVHLLSADVEIPPGDINSQAWGLEFSYDGEAVHFFSRDDHYYWSGSGESNPQLEKRAYSELKAMSNFVGEKVNKRYRHYTRSWYQPDSSPRRHLIYEESRDIRTTRIADDEVITTVELVKKGEGPNTEYYFSFHAWARTID